MDLVILNHGQVARTTPELAPPSPNYHTNGRTSELSTDLSCTASPHGRVFSGTGLELMTFHSHESITLTTRLLRPLPVKK
ncbi:hypothetical protein TNCV_64061 [Trichonephila clavipes]|nr:hypothetical protein TNCV_64061 [Trichonephila clavipes]